MRTLRSPEFLTWRYGTTLLGYRALVATAGLEAGLVIFRIRQRGAAREAVLDDVIVPKGEVRAGRALIKRLGREVDADYIIRVGGSVLSTDGFVRLPRQGPIFTWREVCEPRMPALAEWNVTLGDIELF